MDPSNCHQRLLCENSNSPCCQHSKSEPRERKVWLRKSLASVWKASSLHRLCANFVTALAPCCRQRKVGMKFDDEALSGYLAVAVQAAERAGKIIMNSFYEKKLVEHKGLVDLVTETDKACETLIFEYLKKYFPTHELIGEETSALYGTATLTDAPTWIIDPLDGTTNFVHGFPFVCVSIGLVINKIPVLGVVYNPILEELFTGVQGQGAFLNGERIYASSQTEMGKALLATEIGTNRDEKTVDETTKRIKSLLFKIQSLRMAGSCAMNLCGTACGRLDLFYEIGFGGPWDVAAGVVILQEAGGCVFDPSGGPFELMSRRIAASNAHLKKDFVNELNLQLPL